MHKGLGLLALSILLNGCGGYYILTVPDQVAPAGGAAPAVVRLQRNDFFVLAIPEEQSLMVMSAAGGPQRGAYTDKEGYAGTTVPVPDEPGRYEMTVFHTDREGEEVRATAPVYVWPADAPIAAVDLDGLPWHGGKKDEAAGALNALAAERRILYMTRESVAAHARLHDDLAAAGYPDGPVLVWRRQYWHVEDPDRWKAPRILVTSTMVSQLAEMRRTFANLDVGVCTSRLAARGFAEANLNCAVVGRARARPEDVAPGAAVRRFDSWSALGEGGL
jgi:hypothetical protein